MSKVVILEPIFDDVSAEAKVLKEMGTELVQSPSDDEDTVLRYAQGANALVSGHVKITDKVLGAAPNCKLVMQAGIGLDNVDVAAASRRGVFVANMPGYCTEEVVEHTLALMLALQRKICLLDRNVKKGGWKKASWGKVGADAEPIFRIKGQVLGLVGFGGIGRALSPKAAALGYRVVAVDPFVDEEEMNRAGAQKTEFNELLKLSDVVSIHAPLSKETHHLFNADTIGKMKMSAFLVNTSRGRLVDQKSLYKALKEGNIAGAALDVLEKEPPDDEALFGLDNVIITPHAGHYSEEVMGELKAGVFRQIIAVLRGGHPEHWVNRNEMSR
ncbi:C-terminal binding protein [Chloroflexota bacterium]